MADQSGECKTQDESGQQGPSVPSEIEIKQEPISQNQQVPRRPQRKISVFSHDGFKNLHQLDQQTLKQRSISYDVIVMKREQEQQQQLQKQGSSDVKEEPNMICDQQQDATTSTTTLAPTSSVDTMNNKGSGQQANNNSDKNRRSIRSDTLGSTGSSRASSCDEPTIVDTSDGNQLKQQQQPDTKPNIPPPFESIKTQLADGKSIPNAQLIQQHIDRLISQNEAIIDNWNLVSIRSYNCSRPETTTAGTTATVNTTETPISTATGNNNSSSSSSSNSLTSAQQQQQQQQTLKRPSTSYGNQAELDQKTLANTSVTRSGPNNRPAKRWSTTALSNQGLLCHPASRQSSQIISPLSLANSASSSTSGISSGDVSTSSQRPSFPDLQAALTTKSHSSVTTPRAHLLASGRKRSAHCREVSPSQQSLFPKIEPPSNFASEEIQSNRSNYSDIFGFNGQQNQSAEHLNLPRNSTTFSQSISVPNSPKPNSSFLDVQQFLNSRFGPTSNRDHQQQSINHQPINQWLGQQQVQLNQPGSIESAIENLSLKKREEDNLQQQQVGRFDLDQANQKNRDDFIMEALLFEQQRRQQEILNASQGDQHHLYSRQQKELFEQQLEKLRHSELAASIEREQQKRIALVMQQYQQLDHNHQHLHQHHPSQTHDQMASLMAMQFQQHRFDHGIGGHNTCNNNNITPNTAANYQQYLREHQASESMLLNEFLSNIMLNREEQQRDQLQRQLQLQPPERHLEHGSELMTQSLDSATPAHQCEACDIPFWTRNTLNYHLETQCSAKQVGFPNDSQSSNVCNKPPISFSFNGPNGFDTLSLLNTRQQSLPLKKRKISEPNMRY